MIFETSYDFYICNSRIEIAQSFKYLGVNLFKNGNWNHTQQRIAQHAQFSRHYLFIVYNQLELPVSKKIYLFDSFVMSTLNYCAEVWGHHAGQILRLYLRNFVGEFYA
jgi:hypothetical protein